MTIKNLSFRVHVLLTVLVSWALINPALAADTTPVEVQVQYEKLAGRIADPNKGQKFFNMANANDLSCASCHGNPPIQAHRHVSTGKSIAALAPKSNPERLTDSAKIEKWFRRNCKDVLNRECTPPEKADVVAYLRSL